MTLENAQKKLEKAGAEITRIENIGAGNAVITADLNRWQIKFSPNGGARTNSHSNIERGYTDGSDFNFFPSLTAAIRHCN